MRLSILVKALQYAIQFTICVFVGVAVMSFVAQFGIQLAMHSAQARLVDAAMGYYWRISWRCRPISNTNRI